METNAMSLSTQECIERLRERGKEIYKKLKNGETEEAVVTGKCAYTDSEWAKLLRTVDGKLEEIRKEQADKKREQEKELEAQLAEGRESLEARQRKEIQEKMIQDKILQDKILQESELPGQEQGRGAAGNESL